VRNRFVTSNELNCYSMFLLDWSLVQFIFRTRCYERLSRSGPVACEFQREPRIQLSQLELLTVGLYCHEAFEPCTRVYVIAIWWEVLASNDERLAKFWWFVGECCTASTLNDRTWFFMRTTVDILTRFLWFIIGNGTSHTRCVDFIVTWRWPD